MTDEYKLRKQQDRGARAEAVLNNELVVEAFAAIEAELMKAWQHSAADEKEQRDNAYMMFRLLQNFKAQFSQAVHTGKAAQKQLMTISDPSKIRRMMRNV